MTQGSEVAGSNPGTKYNVSELFFTESQKIGQNWQNSEDQGCFAWTFTNL